MKVAKSQVGPLGFRFWDLGFMGLGFMGLGFWV